MDLVIASSNSHKILFLKEIIQEIMPSISLFSLFDFPNCKMPLDAAQQSASFHALQKSKHASRHLQMCALAEEWRLVIPALEKQYEDIFSPNNTAFQQQKIILQALESKKEYERSAFLESFVACTFPDGSSFEAHARVEGTITEIERGKGSTDFDSIFMKYDYAKTLAELSPQVRCRISHRRKALEKLLLKIETRLKT